MRIKKELKELFAKKLKAISRQRELSDVQIVRAAWVEQTTYSKYVNASSMPTSFAICRIACALQVEPSELFPTLSELNSVFSKKKIEVIDFGGSDENRV
jgi:transcriptional regulator with XRE-family HTH domain